MKNRFIVLLLVLSMICSLGQITVAAAETIQISATGVTVIEAENFEEGTQSIVQFFPNGASKVGPFNQNDWYLYNVSVEKAGTYNISVVFLSPSANTYSIEIGGVEAISRVQVEGSGSWADTAERLIGECELPQGETTIKVLNHGLGGYVDCFKIEKVGGGTEEVPDNSIVVSVSGETMLEAESRTAGNKSSFFESGGVMIGEFNQNDWYSFDIYAEEAGTYTASIALFTPAVNKVSVDIDGETVISQAEVPGSGSWAERGVQTIGEIELPTGNSTIKFTGHGLGAYVDCFILEKAGSESGDVIPDDSIIVSADGETVLEAENCTGGNKSVFIDNAGAKVGEFNQNDWYSFDIYVEEEGTYTASVALFTPAVNKVSVEINGETLISQAEISSTGGWGERGVKKLGVITLPAGNSTIKFTGHGLGSYVDCFILAKSDGEGGGEGGNEPDDDGDAITLSTEDVTVIQAESYKTASSASPLFIDLGGGNKVGECYDGIWFSYDINVIEAGDYLVSVLLASPAMNSFSVQCNGEEVISLTAVDGSGDWGIVDTRELRKCTLPEGKSTIKVLNHGAGCYLDALSFEYLEGSIEVKDIKAGEVSVLKEGSVSKGADSFDIMLTKEPLAKTVTQNTVYISNGQEIIPARLTIDGKTITVDLKKSLEYGESYTITINGVSDKFGFTTVSNSKYTFTTDGDDVGKAEILISDSGNNYREIEISGVVTSSKDLGIEGRDVTLSYKTPDGNLNQNVAEVVSEKDGVYNISYTLPEASVSGIYEFTVTSDYVQAAASGKINYVSENDESAILKALENTASEADVIAFFNTYKELLGLSPIDDMSALSSKSPVYNYFIGRKMSSCVELKKDYYTQIVLARVNQAGITQNIADVFASEDNCIYLGVSKERFDLVSKNKSDMLGVILDLPTIDDVDAFSKECTKIIEKYLAMDNGKEELISSATDKSVYIGQGIEIDLGFTEKQSDVSELVYIVECEDSSLLDDMRCELDIKGTSNISVSGNKLTLTIIPERVLNNADEIGTLTLTAPGKTGECQLTLNADVTYDVEINGEVEKVTATLKTKTINVSVSKKEGSSQGGSPSRIDGGGVGGKTDVSQKPSDDNKQSETKNKYEFTDLDNVKWAEDSIYALVLRGVVSENEEKLFYPNNNITREEFVKLVVCALGMYNKDAQTEFSDVEKGKWYYTYVASAAEYGIVTGNDEGSFGIGQYITREDMAVILNRAMEKIGVLSENDVEKFADDENVSEYAKTAVYTMKAKGIINGVGENRFAPKDNATRAMAAKMIFEMIKAVGR